MFTTSFIRRNRVRTALLLMVAMATLLLAAGESKAAGPRPLFQMPVPCGQTWEASTYKTHWNGGTRTRSTSPSATPTATTSPRESRLSLPPQANM